MDRHFKWLEESAFKMDKLTSSRLVANLFALALCCTLSVGLLRGADGVMQPGENVEGNLATEGARDTWTVQLEEQPGLFVRRYISLVTDGFEPVVEFLDDEGSPYFTVRADDDDKRRLFFNWSRSTSVPFRIRVSSDDWWEGGRYFLRVLHVGAPFVIPPGEEGGVLEESGRKVSGVLEAGDIDVFQVTYDSARVKVVGVVPQGSETRVQVVQRGAVRLENLDDDEDAPLWFEVDDPFLHHSEPRYQDYDIVLYNPNVDSAVNYSITLYTVPGDFIVEPGDEGGPLTSGVTHHGHVSSSDMDVWSFELKQDVPVVVGMGAVGFSPIVRLDSLSFPGTMYSWPIHNHNVHWPVNISYVSLPKNFYAPGLVNLSIGGFNTAETSSSYRIEFHEIGQPVEVVDGDEGGWVPEGGVVVGQLPFGDLDLWTFYANQGATIRIEPEELEAVAFQPGVTVFDPLGTPSFGNLMYSPSPLLYEVQNSGIHTMVVFAESGREGGVSGPYAIDVEGLPSQVPALRSTLVESESIRLNWPSQIGAAVLQQNEHLHPEGWTDVMLPVSSGGLNTHMVVPVGDGSMFFRLLPQTQP